MRAQYGLLKGYMYTGVCAAIYIHVYVYTHVYLELYGEP